MWWEKKSVYIILTTKIDLTSNTANKYMIMRDHVHFTLNPLKCWLLLLCTNWNHFHQKILAGEVSYQQLFMFDSCQHLYIPGNVLVFFFAWLEAGPFLWKPISASNVRDPVWTVTGRLLVWREWNVSLQEFASALLQAAADWWTGASGPAGHWAETQQRSYSKPPRPKPRRESTR